MKSDEDVLWSEDLVSLPLATAEASPAEYVVASDHDASATDADVDADATILQDDQESEQVQQEVEQDMDNGGTALPECRFLAQIRASSRIAFGSHLLDSCSKSRL
jgi:hypothetical protein